MSRRHFLTLLGASSLLAACPAPPAPPRRRDDLAPPTQHGVRAIAFDLFTIFDPRGVDRRVAALLGENTAFAVTWKTRLFEYCWIRAASGQYVDFEQLVHDSLIYAVRTHRVPISDAAQANLEAAFTELAVWPDAPAALRDLKARGLRLAVLTNFAPRMIEALITHAGIGDVFEALISTDAARTYKPAPGAYELAETTFGLPRHQIAFAAFGGWDAAGARWYGYPTFWVNRLGSASEELIAADASGPDLAQLATWV